jgi:hypothetical protein
MKSILFAAAFLACASVPVYAEDAAPAAAAPTSQQQKMKDCNAQATGKTGADRKSFLKACLSKDGAPAAATAKTTQQQKMKDCNAEAGSKGLKGADRKSFMSTCLKG